jgi:hypothetical protein
MPARTQTIRWKSRSGCTKAVDSRKRDRQTAAGRNTDGPAIPRGDSQAGESPGASQSPNPHGRVIGISDEAQILDTPSSRHGQSNPNASAGSRRSHSIRRLPGPYHPARPSSDPVPGPATLNRAAAYRDLPLTICRTQSAVRLRRSERQRQAGEAADEG